MVEATRCAPITDDQYHRAVAVVRSSGRASTAFISREMVISLRTAKQIMGLLEQRGIVTAPDHLGKRDVIDHTSAAPSPAPILRFFDYAHLPNSLQEVGRQFADLAHAMDAALPPGAEKSAGLRKLLEAKDCMIRAMLP